MIVEYAHNNKISLLLFQVSALHASSRDSTVGPLLRVMSIGR